MKRIVMTGGPCAGKTTIMSHLHQALENRGYKVFIVPESATELIANGIHTGQHLSAADFQSLLVEKQISKEVIYEKAAAKYKPEKVVILYDRGMMDFRAYVTPAEAEEIMRRNDLTFEAAFKRYDAVIHLVTAADGALAHYESGEGSNNAARSESPEEAITVDRRTLHAWLGHPHLRIFRNTGNFEDKKRAVMKEVFAVLGEPIPKEIERKFLIRKPTPEQIAGLADVVTEIPIVQTYLKRIEPDVERRIRQRGSRERGFSFYYTEKSDICSGERYEREREITLAEYAELLTQADTTLHQIIKTRYCFCYEGRSFELDLFPFSDEFALLEVELNDLAEDVAFPPLDIVREVTEDVRYQNYVLAREMVLPEM